MDMAARLQDVDKDDKDQEDEIESLMDELKNKAARLRAQGKIVEAEWLEKMISALEDAKYTVEGRIMEAKQKEAMLNKELAVKELSRIAEELKAAGGAEETTFSGQVDEQRKSAADAESGAALEQSTEAVQSLAQVIEDASFETKANETRYASELLQTAAEAMLFAEAIAMRIEARKNLEDAMFLGKDVAAKLKASASDGSDSSQVKKMDSVLSRLDHAMKGAWTLGLDVKGDQAHFNAEQFNTSLADSLHIRTKRLQKTHVGRKEGRRRKYAAPKSPSPDRSSVSPKATSSLSPK